MKIIITIIGILFLALSVNSLSATSKKKIIKKVNHITTVEDDSKPLSIKMKKGALEGIKIPVKMATGFSWVLSKLGDNLKQPFKPRVIQSKVKSSDKEVSIKEYQIFYIRAIEIGEDAIEFEYKQPFDKDALSEKDFTVTIEVE